MPTISSGMQPKLPNGWTIGTAITGDDCFFHSFLQCLQQVKPGKTFSIKTLRINCKNFAKKNVNQVDSWIKEVLDNNHALPCIEEYVTKVEFTSDDIGSPKAAALHLQKAIPGCPEVDGRILCNVYNVKLHVIEKRIVHGKTYFLDFVVDRFSSKHSNDIQYDESDVVHIFQDEGNKYLPILRPCKAVSSDSSDGEEAANVLNSKLFKVMCSKNSEDLKIAKMKALLMKGADIDFKDSNNKCNTVLHIAIRKREIKVIGFLVKINANIHIKNSEGISALEYAEHLEKSDIVDILHKRIVCTTENEDPRLYRDNVESTKQNEHTLNDKYNMQKSSMQRPTFRRGESPGATGHDFEIQLLTLFKLRGEQQTTNFYLAGNHAKAESFDDVVFQYWNDKRECKIIFLQAKHRDDESIRKINFTTFRTDKNFELYTYFDSYLKVRKAFKDDENDLIFKGPFRNKNCSFVIFTNACLDEGDTEGLICLSNEKWDDFHIGYGGKVIKLKVTDAITYLKEQEMRKYVNSIASKFIEFSAKENNSDMMTDDVVQAYHVFWAESVISVNKTVQSEQVIMKGKAVKKTRNFHNARMRQAFLDGTIDDPLLGRLRNGIVRKYAERYLVSKKGKDPSFDSNDHRAFAFEELVSFLAKLDHTNIRRDDITSEAVFEVICNLTGSLLAYDKTDGKLKFSTYQDLGISGKNYMDQLKIGYNNQDLQGIRFDLVDDVAKRKLQNMIFKVPEGFGNVTGTFRSSYSVENMCKQFADLIESCTLGDTCVINKVNDKKLMKDLSQLVGNVLVLADDNGLLKLTEKMLEGKWSDVLENMKAVMHEQGRNLQTRFDFQMETFPKLSLLKTSKNDKYFPEFIQNLTIYTNQPNSKKLKQVITNEMRNFYQLTDDELNDSFLRIDYKMTKMWQEKGTVKYLRKDDGFFGDIVRNGIHFHARYPVPTFTGRVDELSQLHALLHASNSDGKFDVPTNLAVISGLGGIGKSELARKYAFEYGDIYDNNVIWIDADNSESIRYSFRILCQNVLNFPVHEEDGRERDMNSIVHDVYSFFAKRKSLFVFDNVPNYQSEGNEYGYDLQQFLPSPSSTNTIRPHIIVTSRNQSWPTDSQVRLDVFSDYEAVQFVKTFLKIENDQEDFQIKSLTDSLQNFPLALQQSVAYIREAKEDCKTFTDKDDFQIADYLKLYEQQNRKLLNFKFPEDSLDAYTTTTFNTWNITIATIGKLQHGELARRAMNVMAYLAPSNIPVEFFMKIVGNNQQRLTHVIAILTQYSMITEYDGTINIHRLVQNVIRINLHDESKERLLLRDALSIIDYHVDDNLIAHGVSIWNFATQHEPLIKRFNKIPSKIIISLMDIARYKNAYTFGIPTEKLLGSLIGTYHPSTLSVQHNTAYVLFKQGKYNEALISARNVLEKRRKTLGFDHKDTLSTEHNIAQALQYQGKYEDALQHFRAVHEKQAKLLGPDDPSVLTTEHNIALALSDQGNYNEALTSHEEVFGKKCQILGSDHPSTLITKSNLASALSNHGKYNEALSMYKSVFDVKKKVLGHDHPSTLTTQSNMALVLSNQGKYSEALSCYEEVLEMQIKVLGRDHPNTLMTESNLVFVRSKLGNFKETLPSFKEIFEKLSNILSHDHPEALITERHIAQQLSKQGKYDEALGMYEVVLEKQIKMLGTEHPSVLTTQNNIANVLANQGKYNEALTRCSDVFQKQTKTLGPYHPFTLISQNNMARIMTQQGKHNEALQSYAEVLDKQIEIFGADSKSVLDTRNNIALVLFNKGNYNDAFETYTEVFEKRITTLGPEHPETVDVQYEIARVQSKMGKYNEALTSYKEIIEKQVKIFGPDHPSTLRTQNNMALVMFSMGNYDDTLSSLIVVFEKQSQILGPDHPSTLNTHDNIALVLSNQGNYAESLARYNDVLRRKMNVLGSDNPDTLTAQNNLALVLTKQGNYNDALNIYKDVFQKKIRILGPEHPSTLATQHSIAQVMFSLGKYEEALTSYKEVFQKIVKALGPDHPSTLTTQHNIAHTCFTQKKYNEALSIYREVYEKQSLKLGPEHPSTLTSKKHMDQVLIALEQSP